MFEILSKKNRFPQAPEILKDKDITAKYASMIAKAQKTAQADLFQRALGTLLPVIQLDQNVLDNFNGDAAFEYLFELFGLPQEIKRTSDEVEDNRAKKREQMEQMMAQQQNQADADVIAKVGPTAVQSKAVDQQA